MKQTMRCVFLAMFWILVTMNALFAQDTVSTTRDEEVDRRQWSGVALYRTWGRCPRDIRSRRPGGLHHVERPGPGLRRDVSRHRVQPAIQLPKHK